MHIFMAAAAIALATGLFPIIRAIFYDQRPARLLGGALVLPTAVGVYVLAISIGWWTLLAFPTILIATGLTFGQVPRQLLMLPVVWIGCYAAAFGLAYSAFSSAP